MAHNESSRRATASEPRLAPREARARWPFQVSSSKGEHCRFKPSCVRGHSILRRAQQHQYRNHGGIQNSEGPPGCPRHAAQDSPREVPETSWPGGARDFLAAQSGPFIANPRRHSSRRPGSGFRVRRQPARPAPLLQLDRALELSMVPSLRAPSPRVVRTAGAPPDAGQSLSRIQTRPLRLPSVGVSRSTAEDRGALRILMQEAAHVARQGQRPRYAGRGERFSAISHQFEPRGAPLATIHYMEVVQPQEPQP
jgi:hypothetical protein